MTIIDVSEWQGVINWNKARPQIDGVILRCGCGTSYDDKQWLRNVRECERLGIPFGVYLYSYAKDVNAARGEAKYNTLVERYDELTIGSIRKSIVDTIADIIKK